MTCAALSRIQVDTLVDRVWGESPPRQARRSLQAHITRIRRVLEQADADGARVLRDSGGYRLVVRPEQLDVFRFRDALRDCPTDVSALRAADTSDRAFRRAPPEGPVEFHEMRGKCCVRWLGR